MIIRCALILAFGVSSLLHGEAYFLKCSQNGTAAEWFLDNKFKSKDAGIISEDFVAVITAEEQKGDSFRSAKVTFTYGQNLKKNDIRENSSGQVHQGLFLIDEEDFKVVAVPLAPQKIEVYAIYPSHKRGFLMIAKHFLGSPVMKMMYDLGIKDKLNDIPFGSTDIFPLEYM